MFAERLAVLDASLTKLRWIQAGQERAKVIDDQECSVNPYQLMQFNHRERRSCRDMDEVENVTSGG